MLRERALRLRRRSLHDAIQQRVSRPRVQRQPYVFPMCSWRENDHAPRGILRSRSVIGCVLLGRSSSVHLRPSGTRRPRHRSSVAMAPGTELRLARAARTLFRMRSTGELHAWAAGQPPTFPACARCGRKGFAQLRTRLRATTQERPSKRSARAVHGWRCDDNDDDEVVVPLPQPIKPLT